VRPVNREKRVAWAPKEGERDIGNGKGGHSKTPVESGGNANAKMLSEIKHTKTTEGSLKK